MLHLNFYKTLVRQPMCIRSHVARLGKRGATSREVGGSNPPATQEKGKKKEFNLLIQIAQVVELANLANTLI